MAEKTYRVKSACAVIYNTDRSAAVTVNRGGLVPKDADPEHIALLLDRGMIEEGDPAGGLDVDADAAPPFPGTDEHPARASRAGKSE